MAIPLGLPKAQVNHPALKGTGFLLLRACEKTTYTF